MTNTGSHLKRAARPIQTAPKKLTTSIQRFYFIVAVTVGVN